MPHIRQVDESAKDRLTKRTKGYQERKPYREAIESLAPGVIIEVEPEEGESLRKIKLNLARASKEVKRDVEYGETLQSTVLAWLKDTDSTAKRKRGRRPRSADGVE